MAIELFRSGQNSRRFFEPRKPAQIWYLGQAESSRKVGKKIGQKEGVETTLKCAFCAVH